MTGATDYILFLGMVMFSFLKAKGMSSHMIVSLIIAVISHFQLIVAFKKLCQLHEGSLIEEDDSVQIVFIRLWRK